MIIFYFVPLFVLILLYRYSHKLHITMKKTICLMLLCFAALSVKSQQMYENKNIKYFPDVIKSEAEKGNVVALKSLGDLYNYGKKYNPAYEGPEDINKALECYKKAAEYGYPQASWEIARMYASKKLDDPDGKEVEKWYDKALKDFKLYADRGDADAMGYLAEFYAGFSTDKYEDKVKNIYWSLRALEEGNPSGASSMYLCYAYGKGVDADSVFSLAWDARYCIEADNKKWGAEQYPSYERLVKAGYTKNDWKFLAEPTYMHLPRISTQNEDSINDVVLLTIDLLNEKAKDFKIANKVYTKNKALAATSAQEMNGTFSSGIIPATQQSVANTNQTNGRNWLSAIGRAINIVSSASGGQGFISGFAQAVQPNGVAGNINSSSVDNSAVLQSFKYTGEQRKGQRDSNGRIISSEITTPVAMGQGHYIWYEDGYCLATTVTTCVCCMGKKYCTICNGRGGVYNSYLNTTRTCPACLGSKVCKYCHGVGGQVITKLWAPGEAEAYQAAKKEEESEEVASSSSSSATSGSGTCPDCGGKGYMPQSYKYAASSSFAPYHNSGGTECYICGEITDHYHYRCTTCKRH